MSFIAKKSLNESIKIIGALVQECAETGGLLCQTLKNMFYMADYRGIIDFHIDYTANSDVNDVLYARQIQALFSKQDFIDLGVDKERVAFDKFLASEEQCRDTNRRFRNNQAPRNAGVDQVLYLAQRKISDILGEVPLISDLHFSFGPGTNTSTKLNETNPRIKLSSRLECSTNFEPFVEEFMNEFPHWKEHHQSTDVVPTSGKLTFVPKTSLTYRAIVIEPILTGCFQKGVGLYIRRALQKVGLNLDNQELNQIAACKGSENGEIATIDLASASDTISYGLVLNLLSPQWFQFLEIARSSEVTYKGQTIELQKFSSMGNAYTFELESLIFFSIAWATCTYLNLSCEYVRSFGDDIVIPTPAVSLLRDVLSHCGFTVNESKSYSEGPFRESCGADYLNGLDIRPFYLKEQISERTLYLMHNWFQRHCEVKLAALILTFIRQDLALWGPDGYGDGHLIGAWNPRSSRNLKRRGYCGGFFDTYQLGKRFNKKAYPGDWIYPTYSIYAQSDVSTEPDDFLSSERVMPRDRCESDPNVIRGSKGYRRISIYTLATSIYGRY